MRVGRLPLSDEQVDVAIIKLLDVGIDTPAQIVHQLGTDRVTYEQVTAALRAIVTRRETSMEAGRA